MSDSLLIECSRESSGVREWQEVKVDFLCLASDSSWKPLSCNSCKLVLMLGWHRRMPVSVFLVSNPGLLRLLIFHSHREACLFKGFSAQHINTFFFPYFKLFLFSAEPCRGNWHSVLSSQWLIHTFCFVHSGSVPLAILLTSMVIILASNHIVPLHLQRSKSICQIPLITKLLIIKKEYKY